MEPNEFQSLWLDVGRSVGEIAFELAPAFPLEFGLATLPIPRSVARELCRAQLPAPEKGVTEVSSQPLPPPPAPRVVAPSPPPPKPITSTRSVLERRGL